MDQNLIAQDSMPKNKTFQWLLFSIAMLEVWSATIFRLFVGSGSMMLFQTLVSVVFFGLLCYMASNRAVRTAALIFIGCSLVSHCLFTLCVGNGIYYLVLLFVSYLFNVYAFSVIISDSCLTKHTKSWVAILCLVYPIRIILHLSNTLLFFDSNLYVEYGDDLFAMPYYANSFYDVLLLALRTLYSIAWYKFIFSGLFAVEKENENRVYDYRFFNRYTVAFIIVTAVVVPAQYLVVLIFA